MERNIVLASRGTIKDRMKDTTSDDDLCALLVNCMYRRTECKTCIMETETSVSLYAELIDEPVDLVKCREQIDILFLLE